ncbi:MAG: 1-deoxy-D-xylulose-5-phosphate reductoisomerase, partial [Synechococcus sp.]
PKLIEATCDRHRSDLKAQPSLDDVLAVDQWARRYVLEASSVPLAA